MTWKILYEKRVQKDWGKLKNTILEQNAKRIVELLKRDPFFPPYEKLVGDLQGLYSRRINIKHRLIYKVLKDENTIVILAMWNHYE